MINWWNILANGTGIVMFFGAEQLNGSVYTAGYRSQLDLAASAPNVGPSMAESQGIIANATNSKRFLYRRIKEAILPTETGYDFELRVFHNTSIDQGEALQFILDGNISELISDGNTTELLLANDGNGFLAKLIG